MSSNLQLFDDVGNHWDGMTGQLESSFGSTATPEDFSTYVVKNMGFIAIHCYGRSCEIRLRPNLVSAATFETMKAWTGERRFDRIVTAAFRDDDWVYGLHIRQGDALAKIEAMIDAARGPRPGDYLVRQIAKEDLPRTTPLHRALHSLIENWPMLSQSVHRDGLSQIVRNSLQGRYHMIHGRPDTANLVYGEIGNGFYSYSESWRAQAAGRSTNEHEDQPYAKWVNGNFKRALELGTPVISDIDAIMQTTKIGRARIRYKCVHLPVRSIGGGTWLLASSILDPSIDLRLDLLQKTA